MNGEFFRVLQLQGSCEAGTAMRGLGTDQVTGCGLFEASEKYKWRMERHTRRPTGRQTLRPSPGQVGENLRYTCIHRVITCLPFQIKIVNKKYCFFCNCLSLRFFHSRFFKMRFCKFYSLVICDFVNFKFLLF